MLIFFCAVSLFYFEGVLRRFSRPSHDSAAELLFHPTSFVETGRPPSACIDPIKS